jgi:hypothetical protein
MSKKLSIGIVGLPNVGKSTLFNLITKQQALAANYPFATIDPNVGVVNVPDERLKVLTDLSKSKKTIPAIVEFYDIAGLVKGANEGAGLGNKFLSHIRETQAIVIVLRAFENSDIVHVENSVDAKRDLEILITELILKDLDTVDKRLGSLEKEARTGDKSIQKNLEILKTVKARLEKGETVEDLGEEEIIKELQLLASKKHVYLINGSEDDLKPELKELLEKRGGHYLVVDLNEAENVDSLIRKAYETLNLISFFTTGEDETRAWTITRGALAPQAAGEIHTDFEHKFIRAEVVPYDKLKEAGSWSGAKQKGWMSLEGKEYEVQDGDVMVIRHG